MLDLINNPYFVLLVCLLIVALGFIAYRPESVPAFIFLAFAAMGVVYETTGIEKVAMLKAALLPLFFVFLLLIKVMRRQRFPVTNLLLVALFIVVVVASSWLNNIDFAVTRPYIGTLLIALVVALSPNNEKTAKYTIVTFALWGGINLLAVLAQLSGLGWAYKGDVVHTGFRVNGLMSSSTMMGIYFVIALNAVHVLYLRFKTFIMRSLLFCLGAGMAVGLLATLSRASLTAWLLSFLFIQYRLRGMKIGSILGIIATAVVVVGLSSLLNLDDMMMGRFAVINKDPSAQYRVPLAEMALRHFESKPFFGVGISQGGLEAKNVLVNSHNTFIQKIMENGLTGFSLFSFLLWTALSGFKTRLLASCVDESKSYTVGLLASLGAIMINGFFHDFSYLMPLWLLIGMGLMTQGEMKREAD